MNETYTKLWLLFVIAARCCAFTGDPVRGGVIVQLFRWRFDDIARECEEFLAPRGYAGVEVAPITEHIVKTGGVSWDEVYYPVSYKISSRSGDEASFKDMVHRCNKVGIKVYVSVVLSHMAREYPSEATGYAGSKASTAIYEYPAVPYSASDFNQPLCYITSDYNKTQMRLCNRPYDHHLNHTNPEVRGKLRSFLNKLISFGVAGFSIDAADRIDPDKLKTIFSRLRFLNASHGFSCESEPFIYLEYDRVIQETDVSALEYYALGRLADYKYLVLLARAFQGSMYLYNLQEEILSRQHLLPEDKAFVFIDAPAAHRLTNSPRLQPTSPKSYTFQQRNTRPSSPRIMQLFEGQAFRLLRAGVAFMLAYPSGLPRIMSSFNFQTGPPVNGIEIESVQFNGDNCTNGWICEHRWPAIYNMIKFRNIVGDAKVTNVWTDRSDNFAFTRENKGFILFNGNYWFTNFRSTLQTGLPKGEYCDVIKGEMKDGKCTGKTVSVDERGFAYFYRQNVETGVTAIHIEAKLQ